MWSTELNEKTFLMFVCCLAVSLVCVTGFRILGGAEHSRRKKGSTLGSRILNNRISSSRLGGKRRIHTHIIYLTHRTMRRRWWAHAHFRSDWSERRKFEKFIEQLIEIGIFASSTIDFQPRQKNTPGVSIHWMLEHFNFFSVVIGLWTDFKFQHWTSKFAC